MIIAISDNQFKNIMKNQDLHLPIRRDGKDFEATINSLLDGYVKELNDCCQSEDSNGSCDEIEADIEGTIKTCDLLKRCIYNYHCGFPARAFNNIKEVMKRLMPTPLMVYQKSGALERFQTKQLHLFRLRNIGYNEECTRKAAFHVPSCIRSKISTCRYSIAGYPSLYLTTSIDLGLEEIQGKKDETIVSRFEIKSQQKAIDIKVLELGIKPQDFCEDNHEGKNTFAPKRKLISMNLSDKVVRSNYLKWYPLIAVCSFIRADKNAPFSSEYIVPQLLMQWVRTQIKGEHLMGIRYFSCASVCASDLGFDYVFPVSDTKYSDGYCSVLSKSFQLTHPVYLKDYVSVDCCERHLINCCDLEEICPL